MSKLELFVTVAIGQIATIIAMLKRQPQTPKIKRWVVGLKAASAALSEIVSDAETELESPG